MFQTRDKGHVSTSDKSNACVSRNASSVKPKCRKSRRDPLIFVGLWYIYSPVRNMTLLDGGAWGSANSIPLAGDYDGDGKTDLAVYQGGLWYIYSLVRSSTLLYGGAWGGPNSIPVK